MLGRLRTEPLDKVPLFEALRDLTMEIAANALFGIDLAHYAHEVRALSSGYTSRLARGDLFDFLLPLWFPSPRDWARRRFRRKWLALIGQIISDRRRLDDPDDRFDLWLATRIRGGDASATGAGGEPEPPPGR